MTRTGKKRKMSECSQDSSSSKDVNSEPDEVNNGKTTSKSGRDKKRKVGQENVEDDNMCIENCPKGSKKRGPVNGQFETNEAEDGLYFVEDIRQMRTEKGKRFFLVKWLGYEEEENSWEPECNMTGSHDLISKFVSDKFFAQDKTVRPKNAEQKQGRKQDLKQENKLKTAAVQREIKKPKLDTGQLKPLPPSPAKQKPTGGAVPCDPKLPKYPLVIGKSQQKNGSFVLQQAPRNSPSPILGSIKQVRGQQQHYPKNQQVNCTKQVTQFPNNSSRPQNVHLQQEQRLKQYSKFPMRVMKPQTKSSKPFHTFRHWSKNKVNLLHLQPELHFKNQSYNLIVTEDIDNLSPTYFYGAIEGADGQMYVLVQFEGHPYLDIVPPFEIYKQFPGMENYFDLQTDIATATH